MSIFRFLWSCFRELVFFLFSSLFFGGLDLILVCVFFFVGSREVVFTYVIIVVGVVYVIIAVCI